MRRTKKREAVLYHAQDEKGGAVLRRAEDEGRMQFYVMLRTRINVKLRRSPVMNQEYYGFTSAHYT